MHSGSTHVFREVCAKANPRDCASATCASGRSITAIEGAGGKDVLRMNDERSFTGPGLIGVMTESKE